MDIHPSPEQGITFTQYHGASVKKPADTALLEYPDECLGAGCPLGSILVPSRLSKPQWMEGAKGVAGCAATANADQSQPVLQMTRNNK